MTDTYGAFTVPATQGDFGGRAVDPALDSIAAYLKAVMPALVGDAWSAIAPGETLIKTVFTVRPEDALVNANHLPGLFVWRGKSKKTREAEDYLISRTQVTALWLLWWDSPVKREKRMPFQGAFTNIAHVALSRGRHAAWVVPGDTVDGVSYRGSVLAQQAGLFEPINDLDTQELDVALDPEHSGQQVRYKALSLVFTIAERMFQDPAGWASATSTTDPNNATPPDFPQPAALDLTLSQADNALELLKPKP